MTQQDNLPGAVRAFDPARVSAGIECIRSHTARLSSVADTASQLLHDYFEYQLDEPHLGQCMDVVRHLLDQAHTAESPLAALSQDIDLQTRAEELAAAWEKQRLALNRARHIALATVHILKSIERADDADEIIESLRDFDNEIRSALDHLHQASMSLSTPPTN